MGPSRPTAPPVSYTHLDVYKRQEQCTQKYHASLFNISAMSFGSLSDRAQMSLNRGAKKGNFYHNTGEGGISPYHMEGGDLCWQIGTCLLYTSRCV